MAWETADQCKHAMNLFYIDANETDSGGRRLRKQYDVVPLEYGLMVQMNWPNHLATRWSRHQTIWRRLTEAVVRMKELATNNSVPWMLCG